MGINGQYRGLVSTLGAISLYIHFPWCVRKCPYCDFNSHRVKDEIPQQEYVDALLTDLDGDLALLSAKPLISSIFFGGGTPSLMDVSALARLLEGVAQRVSLTPDCEITLEANPGTAESAKFAAFRQLGINRLSIGIQSFDDAQLQNLGRIHDSNQAKQAVAMAKAAGFDNFNLDLMFGLPKQTPEQAQRDVEQAIALQPTHISYYQLTLEPNTFFYQKPPPIPEADAVFAIQQAGQTALTAAGYAQYEISAYAQPGKQCRHNRNYWQFGDYLGIGAGAHGKLSINKPDRILRTSKPKHPTHYLMGDYDAQRQAIAASDLPLEYLMNQLRLRDGFTLDAYQNATGLSADSLQPNLERCFERGWLVKNHDCIQCSTKGWNFLDSILEQFLAEN